MILPAQALPCPPRPPARSRGAALVVGLLILLVITIIGLSSMRSTLLEERMAGNLRDRARAFEAAEAALRAAEASLLNSSPRPVASAGGPVWPADGPDPDTTNATPWWFEPSVDGSWWSSNATPASLSASAPAVPAYVIEELQFVPDGGALNIGQGTQPGRWFYRITARATGADAATEVLLQTTYAVRF